MGNFLKEQRGPSSIRDRPAGCQGSPEKLVLGPTRFCLFIVALGLGCVVLGKWTATVSFWGPRRRVVEEIAGESQITCPPTSHPHPQVSNICHFDSRLWCRALCPQHWRILEKRARAGACFLYPGSRHIGFRAWLKIPPEATFFFFFLVILQDFQTTFLHQRKKERKRNIKGRRAGKLHLSHTGTNS